MSALKSGLVYGHILEPARSARCIRTAINRTEETKSAPCPIRPATTVEKVIYPNVLIAHRALDIIREPAAKYEIRCDAHAQIFSETTYVLFSAGAHEPLYASSVPGAVDVGP